MDKSNTKIDNEGFKLKENKKRPARSRGPRELSKMTDSAGQANPQQGKWNDPNVQRPRGNQNYGKKPNQTGAPKQDQKDFAAQRETNKVTEYIDKVASTISQDELIEVLTALSKAGTNNEQATFNVVRAVLKAQRTDLLKTIEPFVPKHVDGSGQCGFTLLHNINFIRDCPKDIFQKLVNFAHEHGNHPLDENNKKENGFESLFECKSQGRISQDEMLNRYMVIAMLPENCAVMALSSILNRVSVFTPEVFARIRYLLTIQPNACIEKLASCIVTKKIDMMTDKPVEWLPKYLSTMFTLFSGAANGFRTCTEKDKTLDIFFKNHKCQISTDQQFAQSYIKEMKHFALTTNCENWEYNLETLASIFGCLKKLTIIDKDFDNFMSCCLIKGFSDEFDSQIKSCADNKSLLEVELRVRMVIRAIVNNEGKCPIEFAKLLGSLREQVQTKFKFAIDKICEPIIGKIPIQPSQVVQKVVSQTLEYDPNEIDFIPGLTVIDAEDNLDDATYSLSNALKKHDDYTKEIIQRFAFCMIEKLSSLKLSPHAETLSKTLADKLDENGIKRQLFVDLVDDEFISEIKCDVPVAPEIWKKIRVAL